MAQEILSEGYVEKSRGELAQVRPFSYAYSSRFS